MLVVIMLFQIVFVVKMFVAETTVVVAWTLNVVLSQRPFGTKLHLAILAIPLMSRGCLLMPTEAFVRPEKAFAEVTIIGHCDRATQDWEVRRVDGGT